ncbi:MAG TPA: FeoB small GTPase domain-containing protein, partial [Spirochaetales bacterium]|nr:FeoB small GTPase domain-containing protein [Spirochaetales bacterium]
MPRMNNKTYTVAVIGQPNCGKTTLFNALTGSNQYVGNWPGVTVEKKSGKFELNGNSIVLQDLPGTYSLIPWSDD